MSNLQWVTQGGSIPGDWKERQVCLQWIYRNCRTGKGGQTLKAMKVGWRSTVTPGAMMWDNDEEHQEQVAG